MRATDPWSLLRNSDRWRRNPLIDDGHYFTTGAPAGPRHPERPRPADHRLAAPRAGTSTPPATTSPRWRCPRRVRPPIPDRRRLRLRPAHARSPALFAADSEAASERPPPRRRLDRRRPPADPAPRLARRTRPAAGLRIPRVHLRAARLRRSGAIPRSATASIVAQVEVRTRLGLNLGYRMPRPRGRRRDGSSGSRRRIWSSSATRARPGWPGDGPGQVPVEPASRPCRMGVRRGRRASTPGRSAPTSPRASPRMSRSSSSSGCSAASSVYQWHSSVLGRAGWRRCGWRGHGPARSAAWTSLAAQARADAQPVRLHVRLAPDSTPAGSRAPVVRSENLLGDGAAGCRRLRSGLPVRLHYRVEVWRSRDGWFDAFDRQAEWDVVVRHEPLLDQYTLLTLVGGRGRSGATPRSMRSARRSPLPTRSTCDPTRRAATTTRPRCRSRRCRIPISTSWSGFWRATWARWPRASEGVGDAVGRGATRFLLRLAGTAEPPAGGAEHDVRGR